MLGSSGVLCSDVFRFFPQYERELRVEGMGTGVLKTTPLALWTRAVSGNAPHNVTILMMKPLLSVWGAVFHLFIPMPLY